jgi:hypothetical protein
MIHRIIFSSEKWIVIFLFFFSCHQNSNTDSQKLNPTNSNKKLRLLIYGLPDALEKEAAEYLVAEKWGIEFLRAGGCIIESQLKDSIEKENRKVESLMNNKYGINWRSEFDNQVKEELKRQNIVIQLLEKEKNIISKKREVENEGYYWWEYTSKPITKNEYKVNVTSWGKINGNNEIVAVSYFRFYVNIEKNKVQMISDSIMRSEIYFSIGEKMNCSLLK